MIFPLNKDVDNKNLICIMKLGGEHGQIKSFVLLSFSQSWGLKEWIGALSSSGNNREHLDNETHQNVNE